MDKVCLQEATADIYSQCRHQPVHSWQAAGAVRTHGLVHLLALLVLPEPATSTHPEDSR